MFYSFLGNIHNHIIVLYLKCCCSLTILNVSFHHWINLVLMVIFFFIGFFLFNLYPELVGTPCSIISASVSSVVVWEAQPTISSWPKQGWCSIFFKYVWTSLQYFYCKVVSKPMLGVLFQEANVEQRALLVKRKSWHCWRNDSMLPSTPKAWTMKRESEIIRQRKIFSVHVQVKSVYHLQNSEHLVAIVTI